MAKIDVSLDDTVQSNPPGPAGAAAVTVARVISGAGTIGLAIALGMFSWRLFLQIKRRLLWRVRRKLIQARDGTLDAEFEISQALANLAAAVGDPTLAINVPAIVGTPPEICP